MRITIPIVSAGNRWSAKIPRIDLDACYPKDADGEPAFDEAEYRRQLRECNRVQFASDDFGSSAVAFSAILLSSLCDWLDDNTKDTSTMPRVRETLRRMDHRLGNGKITYCRISVSRARQQIKGREIGGVKVDISTDSRDVVQPIAFEREFAMLVADFCEVYSKRYADRGDPPLMFGSSALLVCRELHERTVEHERESRVRQLNADRMKCERRTASGHCSPCKFECPCYKDGMCAEAKI